MIITQQALHRGVEGLTVDGKLPILEVGTKETRVRYAVRLRVRLGKPEELRFLVQSDDFASRPNHRRQNERHQTGAASQVEHLHSFGNAGLDEDMSREVAVHVVHDGIAPLLLLRREEIRDSWHSWGQYPAQSCTPVNLSPICHPARFHRQVHPAAARWADHRARSGEGPSVHCADRDTIDRLCADR
jgi:hypothetical protein